jgi:hypothetical protein
MAARAHQPKGAEKPTTVLVRLKAVEKRFIEAAAVRKTEELDAQVRGSSLGTGALIRGGALELAEKILGMSLGEFAQSQGKRGG